MPPTRPRRVPTYRRHKPSGQAVVTLDGRDVYLGRYGSPTSKEAYARLIAEWTQRGHRPPTGSGRPEGGPRPPTVNELIVGYLRHCHTYYRRSPRELEKIKFALRQLRDLYGRTDATRFGSLALKAFQSALARTEVTPPRRKGDQVKPPSPAKTLTRRTVNMRVDIVRRVFKWAAGNELVPVTVYQALMTVEGLKRGRSEAREGKKVGPVSDEVVRRTLHRHRAERPWHAGSAFRGRCPPGPGTLPTRPTHGVGEGPT